MLQSKETNVHKPGAFPQRQTQRVQWSLRLKEFDSETLQGVSPRGMAWLSTLNAAGLRSAHVKHRLTVCILKHSHVQTW